MRKILMVFCTACFLIAATPANKLKSPSSDLSQWIIKEWTSGSILGSDSNYWIVTGAFNLSTQQFSGTTQAYRVSAPGTVYSASLASSILGCTTCGGAGVYVLILDGGNVTASGVTIPFVENDRLYFD